MMNPLAVPCISFQSVTSGPQSSRNYSKLDFTISMKIFMLLMHVAVPTKGTLSGVAGGDML